MLLFSVAARISKAESRRQDSWPRNPPVHCCCCWYCEVKPPRKRSGSYCRHVEGKKTREQRQPVRGRKAGLQPWHTLASVQMLQGAGSNHLSWQAHLQPATEENRFLRLLLLAQYQGSKGCWSWSLRLLLCIKNGKLERLLYSKTCLYIHK